MEHVFWGNQMRESAKGVSKVQPSVLIVLLNFNSEQDTIACLGSLDRQAYCNYEVVVIDNGSRLQSIHAISDSFPQVPIVCNGKNLGFAEGNNIGLREAKRRDCAYTLLLNNDTVVAPDFLGKLVDVAEANPIVAMVGPTIYYYDGPEIIWSAGGRIDKSAGNTEMIGIGETVRVLPEAPFREVDFVTGCALLVRMHIVEQIGGLDPRFFLYYEEVEWCARARAAGYRIYHVPSSSVWHKISQQSRSSSVLVHYYMTRNRLLFLKAAHLGWRAWAHTLFDYTRTLSSWTLRPKWRSKKKLRNTMVRACIDFCLGRFGQAVDSF
jgi:GT2 family glycosyltransferase